MTTAREPIAQWFRAQEGFQFYHDARLVPGDRTATMDRGMIEALVTYQLVPPVLLIHMHAPVGSTTGKLAGRRGVQSPGLLVGLLPRPGPA